MAQVLGITDERTSCDCCGKSDLKRTVALQFGDADPVFYGTTCAARALKWSVKEVQQAVRDVADAKSRAEQAARNAEHERRMAEWDAWLNAAAGTDKDVQDWTGKPDRFKQIQKMGGHAAAKAAYQATKC